MSGLPIPLMRETGLGSTGLDVLAWKHTLWRLGLLKKPRGRFLTKTAGPAAVAALKKFNDAHHIKRPRTYSIETHHALLETRLPATKAKKKREPAIDAYAAEQYQREAIRQSAIHIYDLAPIPYSQGRPILGIARGLRTVLNGFARPLRPSYQDCSAEVGFAYWLPGLLALLRGGIDAQGEGNTYSLSKRGRGKRIRRGDLQPADLVFYDTEGPGSNSHVGIFVGNLSLFRRNRVLGTLDVIDDGHAGGPFVNRLDAFPINHFQSQF